MHIRRVYDDDYRVLILGKREQVHLGEGRDYVGLSYFPSRLYKLGHINITLPKNPFRKSARRLFSITIFRFKFELHKFNMSDIFPVIKIFPSERYPSSITPPTGVRGLAILTLKFTLFP